MAAVNSVQSGLHLPLSGLASPRLLMCSASMGAEGSVTLQLRETVQTSESASGGNTSLDNALTIGYPDPAILADVLGTLQAAALNNNNHNMDSVMSNDEVHCKVDGIHESSNNNNNILISNSRSGYLTSANASSSGQIVTINCSNSNSSSSSVLSADSAASSSVPTANQAIVVRKPRPKTSSPTRHGPQQCQVCSKIFGNASALAKHKLTHSDERKYVCAMCSKAFKRQDHLNGHMLTHRNKKPYECKADGCGKSYCDARSLRRHTENHHSALAVTASTPQNQSLSPSTGPPTGLSLSPATASGDASSPHGASCIQYTITNESSIGGTGSNPKSYSPNCSPSGQASSLQSPTPTQTSFSPALVTTSAVGSMCNDGLTKHQLDLISQIMQHTKQVSAPGSPVTGTSHGVKTNHTQTQPQLQRPRTWNMQTQLQQSQTRPCAVSVGNVSAVTTSTISNSTLNGLLVNAHQQLTNSVNQQILNIVKIEQKPVECNLCHRKFKNIPALNGHMRLHGGYFKKDTETKKSEKKESSGPPLQTASIGVRALIEEKIISKRCKDLKGAFVVPAPPLATAVRRAPNELETFLTPKSPTTTSIAGSPSSTITNNNSHSQVLSSCIQLAINSGQKTANVSVTTTNQSTSTDNKDATLIELLKRGTKVAVKRTCSDPGQLLASAASELSPVAVPKSSLTAPSTPNATPPLALSLNNGDSTPVELTISQTPSGTGDVFTLTYSADSSSGYFGDHGVYSVSESDTAMLLQTVDTIQLLNDSTAVEQLDKITSISDYSLTPDHSNSTVTRRNSSVSKNAFASSSPATRELQAVLNSPLSESFTDFATIHSKDFILYNNNNNNTLNSAIQRPSVSPLPSPLAYPTPPASHEAVTESSPFFDDSHHFTDAANAFFGNKSNSTFMDDSNGPFFRANSDSNMTENEKILKLKSVLEDSEELFKAEENTSNVFESQVKVEDLLKETPNVPCDLKEFTDQNLSFLDDAQSFLDDSANATSSLSESFFSNAMGNEEVREVLKDVLPNESLSCNQPCEHDIDLYYLPGLHIQSHMMPNSEDPLLSSSPRDFAQRVHQHDNPTQTSTDNINGPSFAKKPRSCDALQTMMGETTQLDENPQISFTVQQAQNDNGTAHAYVISPTVDLPSKPQSPKSRVASISSVHSQHQLYDATQPQAITNSILKRRLRQNGHSAMAIANACYTSKKQELFRSKLRRPSTTHYTPSPILNPERKGAGLYCNLPKSMVHQETVDLGDDFEDAASLVAFLDDSKVNIGNAYQATILPLETKSPDCDANSSDVYEEQMWDPPVASNDKSLTRYIELSKSSAIPLGFHTEEVALKALLQAHGDTHIAVLNLLQSPSNQMHLKWSSSEVEKFLKGLERYGKNFYKISKQIFTKTTSECIQFYYFWKKLCADYKITHLNQDNEFNDHHPSHQTLSHSSETRPHVCEMPDCSASFTSKAALHGHTRIHCIGKNVAHLSGVATGGQMVSFQAQTNVKDDFPCKVCGKVFNKVKSRSAHMKSHRPQENEQPHIQLSNS